MDKRLIEAVAVAAELTGTDFTPAAAKVFAQDLSRYPINQVLAALTRCRREVKGRLVLVDVISRLDDGRPGAEEAWAMLPKNQDSSGVLSREMQVAMGVANDLLIQGDTIAARVAFKEVYLRECQKARDEGVPVYWQPTLGHSKSEREEASHDASNRNRLAKGLPALPYKAPEHALPAPEAPRLQLVGATTVGDAIVSALSATPQAKHALAEIRAKLKGDAA